MIKFLEVCSTMNLKGMKIIFRALYVFSKRVFLTFTNICIDLNKFKSSCYFQQLISRYLDTETELLNKYLDVRFEVSELCINT
jgi:hypothetical protein